MYSELECAQCLVSVALALRTLNHTVSCDNGLKLYAELPQDAPEAAP